MKVGNVIEPSRRIGGAPGDLDFACPMVVSRHPPLALHSFLTPGAALRLAERAVGEPCRPVDGIVVVVPVVRGMIRRLFDIRVVGHQRPDVLPERAPVAAKEDVAARLAVEHLQDTGAAFTRRRRAVKQAADWYVGLSPMRAAARGVGACPYALDIAEEQVNARRQERRGCG